MPADIGAYEAKTHLPALLGRVARGERFTITKHGRPVAHLVPIEHTRLDRRREAIERLKRFREGQTLDVPVKQFIGEGRRWQVLRSTPPSPSPGASRTTSRLEIPPQNTYTVEVTYSRNRTGMITVTSAEFQRHFGRYQDEALTQPVAITRNGRERLVMISVDEYRKLKRRSREVIRVEDLSDEEVAQIAAGRMDRRHDHLDSELK